MLNNIRNDYFFYFLDYFLHFVWTRIVAVMTILSILMVGCLFHTMQATNDSRKEFHLDDRLPTFLKDIIIVGNEPLIPTKDISQKEIIDILCFVNLLTAHEVLFLNNESKIPSAIIEKLLNTTADLRSNITTIEGYGKLSVIEPIIIAAGIVGNVLTILYIPLQTNLRKPFYYCIINLAVGDAIALLVNPYCHNLLLYFLNLRPCTFSIYQFILETIIRFSKLFSEMGALILGFVRFLLFVYPIKSRMYLKEYQVFLSFFFSFIISAAYGYLSSHFISDTKGFRYIITSSAVDGLSLILLLTILLVLFYHRYKAAHTSLSAQNTKLPMTVVTIIILALNTFNVATSCLYTFRYFVPPNELTMFILVESYIAIVSAIVHSVNPLIYFIRFNAVRRICLSCSSS